MFSFFARYLSNLDNVSTLPSIRSGINVYGFTTRYAFVVVQPHNLHILLHDGLVLVYNTSSAPSNILCSGTQDRWLRLDLDRGIFTFTCGPSIESIRRTYLDYLRKTIAVEELKRWVFTQQPIQRPAYTGEKLYVCDILNYLQVLSIIDITEKKIF